MTKKSKNSLLCMLAASCALSLTLVSTVFAADTATLSGIDIKSLGKKGYSIQIKADRNISFSKVSTADDKLVLDLKDVKPASFVNTVYNNAANIDHVIIQPTSSSSVRVFIQGQNVAMSSVNLDADYINNTSLNNAESADPVTSNTAVNVINSQGTQSSTDSKVINSSVQPVSQEETIVLDQPVNSFQPADSAGLVAEEPASGKMTGLHLSKLFSTSSFDWILRILALAVIVGVGLKSLKPKKQVKINLAPQVKDNLKEIDLIKSRQSLLKQELQKGNPSVLAKSKVNNSVSRYGIKEYQNSQLPPMSRPVMKTPIDSLHLRPSINANQSALKRMPSSRSVSPAFSNIRKRDIANAQSSLDGIKFLENMAKIYEKSGRVDLARDIHSNIQRAKIAG